MDISPYSFQNEQKPLKFPIYFVSIKKGIYPSEYMPFPILVAEIAAYTIHNSRSDENQQFATLFFFRTGFEQIAYHWQIAQ